MTNTPELDAHVIAAIDAVTEHTTAANRQQLTEELRARGVDVDPEEVTQILFDLGHEGRIDVVDAAPGPDGLPTQGFRCTASHRRHR